jgi:hypothetical protein
MGWSTATDGHPLGNVTPEVQADYVTRAYKQLEQDPYVQVAMWYSLRNSYWSSDGPGWLDQLGLMRTDFTHKPSYDAFKSFQPGVVAADPAAPPTPDPPAPAPATVSPTARASTSGTRRATRTFIALRDRRLVRGRVAGAGGGKVTVKLHRRDGRGRWKVLYAHRMRLGRRGTFRMRLGFRRARTLLVRALYEGSATAAPSRSRALRVSR